MKVGDVVVPVNGQVLRSGASGYTCAVVVSLDPFILTSVGADMKWQSTVKAENFQITGETIKGVELQHCINRLYE